MSTLFWLGMTIFVVALAATDQLERRWVFAFAWSIGYGGFLYQTYDWSLDKSALSALLCFLFVGCGSGLSDKYRKNRKTPKK
jgi:hypothetical protein